VLAMKVRRRADWEVARSRVVTAEGRVVMDVYLISQDGVEAHSAGS
jgi:hypothetical protein